MKQLVMAALVLSLGFGLQAQHELGVTLGTSHLLGDFGGGPGNGTIFLKDIDLQSTQPDFGIFYRYNFAKVLAIRGQFIYGGLNGNDLYSANSFRYDRGLLSKSSLYDLSAQMELHFVPLKFCSGTFRFSPYIAGGVALSKTSPSLSAVSSEGIPSGELQYIDESGNGLSLNIPLAFGVKLKTKKNVVIGLETSYRMTFTDKLDHYVRQQNDQFLLVNASVSYVFCKGGSGKMSREMQCPTYR